MIITGNQREYISNTYNYIMSLSDTSSMRYPYGLPGWKAFHDLGDLCRKLLKLNRMEPMSLRNKTNSQNFWYRISMHIQMSGDPEESLEYLIRTMPVLCDLMDKEDVFSK